MSRECPLPPTTSCTHVWEHIWNINGTPTDAKFATGGDYHVWCPSCGSVGHAPCLGHGLEQDKVTIIFLAYEDPYRRPLDRPVFRNRGQAIDGGVKW